MKTKTPGIPAGPVDPGITLSLKPGEDIQLRNPGSTPGGVVLPKDGRDAITMGRIR